jgi:tetratricopeptide (TPR) repeat protein
MLKRLPWGWIALYATMTLFAVSSAVPLNSMWGINHLAFLPGAWWWVFAVVMSAMVVLTLLREPTLQLDRLIEWTSDHLFERGVWPKVGVATACMILFWVCRTPTHFLGDGYTIRSNRSNYGIGGPFVGSSTAPLVTIAAQSLQSVLGVYDRASVQASFQILSVVSGVICIFNFIHITGYLSGGPSRRLISLFSLCVSGSLLLFFGYIEYYPLLWAGATSCLLLSIRYLRTARGFWLALLFYPIVAAIHIEGLILAPGILVLLAQRFPSISKRLSAKVMMTWAVALIALGVATLTIARSRNLAIARLTLPWFIEEGKDGTVFSYEHFRDILNLILTIIPGAFVLMAWILRDRNLPTPDSVLRYVGLLSLSCGAFILIANPDLGMARDWDLMSIALLPPLLLLILIVVSSSSLIPWRELVGYVSVTCMLVLSFLAASLSQTPSEDRFASLLRVYGDRNRGGWIILERYFENKGDRSRAVLLKADIGKLFLENGEVEQGLALIANRQYAKAIALGRTALQRDRFNAEAMSLLGNAFLKQSEVDSAISYLKSADQLSPYDPRLKNLLGQALLKAGRTEEALDIFGRARKLDPTLTFVAEGIALTHIMRGEMDLASAVADTLLMDDRHSPGAHLVKLVIAIRLEQKDSASMHYREFVQYGFKRSDYSSMIETYGPLFSSPLNPASNR